MMAPCINLLYDLGARLPCTNHFAFCFALCRMEDKSETGGFSWWSHFHLHLMTVSWHDAYDVMIS
jgi:hypothetical protein